MSSQSEYAGTAGQGNFGSGTTSWSNLPYAEGSPVGGDYALNDVLHSSSVSKSLDLYNFSFSILGKPGRRRKLDNRKHVVQSVRDRRFAVWDAGRRRAGDDHRVE